MNYRPRWQRPVISALPESLSDWLTYPGSLTRQLQDCFNNFSVQLLKHQWRRPLLDEALLLQQPRHQYMLQREVFLQQADMPLVYARTMVPRSTYAVMPQRFDELGNKPLGDMLFTDPAVKRGPISVACLTPNHSLYQFATAATQLTPDVLWARRSCFYLAQHPLLVNEVFLPVTKWSHF